MYMIAGFIFAMSITLALAKHLHVSTKNKVQLRLMGIFCILQVFGQKSGKLKCWRVDDAKVTFGLSVSLIITCPSDSRKPVLSWDRQPN